MLPDLNKDQFPDIILTKDINKLTVISGQTGTILFNDFKSASSNCSEIKDLKIDDDLNLQFDCSVKDTGKVDYFLLLRIKIVTFSFFFFCEVGPQLGPQDSGPLIALYLSFKFLRGYLGVQSPYQAPQSRSSSPLLFVLDPSYKVQGLHPYLFQQSAFP